MEIEEWYWIEELRSIATGDLEYRKVAQQMKHRSLEVIPELEWLGSFVDERQHSLNRIGEAARQDLRGRA